VENAKNGVLGGDKP